MSTKPLVIGHRGAPRAARENTVAAFRAAREEGADWVELDVRRTADGVLAVLHDEALPDGRTVAAVPAADLPPGTALLDEALAACEGMGVNVEVKPQPEVVVGPTVDAIRAWGGPALVSSFDAGLVRRFRRTAPDLPTALLVIHVPDPTAVVAECLDAGHAALHPWVGAVDEALVARCHASGLAVNVWTVDDLDRAAELAAWGVDGIVTNTPALLRAELARNRRQDGGGLQ